MDFTEVTHDPPQPIRPVWPVTILPAVGVGDDADLHLALPIAKAGRDALRRNLSRSRDRNATQPAQCVPTYAAKWITGVPVTHFAVIFPQ
jgi:hypothetical protein